MKRRERTMLGAMTQLDIWSILDAAACAIDGVDADILNAELGGHTAASNADMARAAERAQRTMDGLRLLKQAGRARLVEVLQAVIRTQTRQYATHTPAYYHRQLYGPMVQIRTWRGGRWRKVYAIRISGGVLSYRDPEEVSLGWGLLKLDDPELIRLP